MSDAPITAPKGSLCVGCPLFQEGACIRFQRLVETLEDPAPVVTDCPDYLAPEETE